MIALITPTGARPKQIELCSKFMKHQDYDGEVLWIIVDDALPISSNCIPDDFREDWHILKLYPEKKWKLGANTQCNNLLLACDELKGFRNIQSVFMIEDDDYYSPRYLSEMVKKLEGYDVVGECNTVYYNVVYRGWFQNYNIRHASLFQCGFSIDVIQDFIYSCKLRRTFIDMNFFRAVKGRKINLFNGTPLSVGIKGLPGRDGIGIGHRMELKMVYDPYFERLKELIGDDYLYYANI